MDFPRLHDSIEWSVQKLEKPRKNRHEAVKFFAGFHYAENGANRRQPTNFLELATSIYTFLLAPHAPSSVVHTDIPDLKPMAADMEAALNQVPDEIGLTDTLRAVVRESIYSLGIVKVGIAFNGKSVDGEPDTEPFVDLVDFDDYFVDMAARSWREIQYEGNEYVLDIDEARKIFHDPNLSPDDVSADSPSGQMQTRAVSVDDTPVVYNDRILLRDVYLCKEGRLVTYAVSSLKVLRDIPWDGPEGTPYIKLWYSDVPGQLLPLPTVASWRDLHELGNTLFRKLGRQAEAKKTVAAFQGGNDEDVNRLQDADDGDGIRYNGQKPEEITVGGIDQPTLAFYLQIRDLFNILAGNLDSLGGLSPQSETATQDRLINESASARIRDMSTCVTDFARKIFKRLAWYVWTDPVRKRRIVKMADKDLGIGIVKEWTPETRDGDFLDYNFDIAVFSAQDDSPAAKVQKLRGVFNDFLFPLLQPFMEQGASIDFIMLFDFISKNLNLAELNEMLMFPEPSQQTPMPVGNPQPEYVSHKAPVTHRIYERVGRPGATRSGRDAVMSQLLLGGNVQNAQIAQLGGGR